MTRVKLRCIMGCPGLKSSCRKKNLYSSIKSVFCVCKTLLPIALMGAGSWVFELLEKCQVLVLRDYWREPRVWNFRHNSHRQSFPPTTSKVFIFWSPKFFSMHCSPIILEVAQFCCHTICGHFPLGLPWVGTLLQLKLWVSF